MDARKVAEKAMDELFDVSEREGRCISKDAATDLLERHIRAGIELPPMLIATRTGIMGYIVRKFGDDGSSGSLS